MIIRVFSREAQVIGSRHSANNQNKTIDSNILKLTALSSGGLCDIFRLTITCISGGGGSSSVGNNSRMSAVNQ